MNESSLFWSEIIDILFIFFCLFFNGASSQDDTKHGFGSQKTKAQQHKHTHYIASAFVAFFLVWSFIEIHVLQKFIICVRAFGSIALTSISRTSSSSSFNASGQSFW